jgi:tetratricopeptide (TPR) repeat protein
LKHYEAIGDTPNQIFKLRDLKIKLYLNISLCSIKMKEFPVSLIACEEALKLDTKNIKGYYLKARSRILDINSGVDDLKLAVRDLKEGLKIDPTNKPIITQLQKILKIVNINSRREKETYLNMFDKNNSVEDYVKRTIKDEIAKTKREEESKGYSVVTPNQNKRIQKFINKKELEFSFEVKKKKEKFPEIEEIRETIAKGDEAIELYARTGKIAEARKLKSSLQQARYEIEMLD